MTPENSVVTVAPALTVLCACLLWGKDGCVVCMVAPVSWFACCGAGTV